MKIDILLADWYILKNLADFDLADAQTINLNMAGYFLTKTKKPLENELQTIVCPYEF